MLDRHGQMSGRYAMWRLARFSMPPVIGLTLCVLPGLPVAMADPDGAQASLTEVSGSGAGMVLIAPTAEDHGTFAVEVTVNVHDASPSATYTVSRAVDLNPDGVCTLASGWLTNGPLDTSSAGAGSAHFQVQRGTPLVSGTRFDAQFRVLGDDGTELRSECVTVTVR